ncbi:hypothetical protein CHS0354_037272 [Potamilus streckersoni]|uniref:Uncharacterized protein n=1 Tax=Potamilus streckersoni TaxID=2493646 RepID=A0AAE0SXK7_9BIVA|nr:hypothetical protein CHS0354_037272 [Potamilus streckersoni]
MDLEIAENARETSNQVWQDNRPDERINVTEWAQLRRHDAELELPNKERVVMTNQYIIERHGHRLFFELGDSGAGIFIVDEENTLTLIGIAIGMLDLDYCVVTPIEYVLKALGLTLEDLHFEEDMEVSDA